MLSCLYILLFIVLYFNFYIFMVLLCFLLFLFINICPKMGFCALFWDKKLKKMADFCGFLGVFLLKRALFAPCFMWWSCL